MVSHPNTVPPLGQLSAQHHPSASELGPLPLSLPFSAIYNIDPSNPAGHIVLATLATAGHTYVVALEAGLVVQVGVVIAEV